MDPEVAEEMFDFADKDKACLFSSSLLCVIVFCFSIAEFASFCVFACVIVMCAIFCLFVFVCMCA